MINMDLFVILNADFIIVLITLISLLIGWIRGCTKELLSLVAWGGGIFLSITLFPVTKEIARKYISHGLVADFVTICALFIFFLTLLSIINYICSNFIKKSILKTTDKVLGAIFGIIRGVVILSIINLFLVQYIIHDDSEWLTNSRLKPHIESVSNFLFLILPEGLQDKLISHMSQLKKDNLMEFVRSNVIDNVAPESKQNIQEEYEKNKATASNANDSSLIQGLLSDTDDQEFVEDYEESSKQSAEDLATLKPKKLDFKDESKDKSTSKKERADFDRMLSQYDDIDETEDNNQ